MKDLLIDKTEVQLDVRPIIDRGDDPFDEIMTNLDSLQNNEYLTIINYFEPVPLYRHLKQKKYYYTTQKKDGVYYVKIVRDKNGLLNSWKMSVKNILKNKDCTRDRKRNNSARFDENGFYQIDEHKVILLQRKISDKSPDKVVNLDASDLPAPEPLLKILEALNKNPAPEMVIVRHRKKPVHLPVFIKDKKYLVSVFEKKDHVQVYVFPENISVEIS